MRLHVDTIRAQDIYQAAHALPGVSVDVTTHNSRTRTLAYDVHLTGTSGRRANSGRYGGTSDTDDYAATWDEWGMFLAYLYERDSRMRAGGTAKRPVYRDADDFHWQTQYRFETLTPEDQHKNHRWDFVTVGYFSCTKCDAERMYRRD